MQSAEQLIAATKKKKDGRKTNERELARLRVAPPRRPPHVRCTVIAADVRRTASRGAAHERDNVRG